MSARDWPRSTRESAFSTGGGWGTLALKMAEDVFGIVGSTQGPFTVERVVAHGGFGVVYRAYHGAFRAPVALKCLKMPGSIPDDLRAQFLEQFREEAEMLFRLSAAIPSVVRPLHHDLISTSAGLFVPFIALEWLDGSTLASFIESRAARRLPLLGPEDAARLLTPVARALEAAHHFPGPKGPICVIHRDVKPSNIFLASLHGAQVVKILDFGIARSRDAASVIAGASSTTGSAPTAFTPRYGAPEQWAPRRFGTTGPWTDVWGLALTFMEILAGRPIIDGDPMAMMGTIMDEKRRPTPRTEGIAVNDALEALFRRALAIDPRARPADAGAFWDEVERALTLEPSAAPIARPGRPGPRGSLPDALDLEFRAQLPSVNAPTELADGSPRPPPASRRAPAAGEVATLFNARGPLPGAPPDRPGAPPGPAAVVRGGADRPGLRPPASSLGASPDAPRREGPPPPPQRPAPPPPQRPEPPPPQRPEPPPPPQRPAAAPPQRQERPPPPQRPAPPRPHRPAPPPDGAAGGPPSSAGRRPQGDKAPPLSLDLDPDFDAHHHARPQRLARHVAPHLGPPSEPRGGRAVTAELRAMFALPLRLAGAGVLVSGIDQTAASLLFEGQRVGLGPLRLIWVAAALVLIGIAVAVFRLLGSSR